MPRRPTARSQQHRARRDLPSRQQQCCRCRPGICDGSQPGNPGAHRTRLIAALNAARSRTQPTDGTPRRTPPTPAPDPAARSPRGRPIAAHQTGPTTPFGLVPGPAILRGSADDRLNHPVESLPLLHVWKNEMPLMPRQRWLTRSGRYDFTPAAHLSRAPGQAAARRGPALSDARAGVHQSAQPPNRSASASVTERDTRLVPKICRNRWKIGRRG